LLDIKGNVIAQLDQDNAVTHSSDALVQAAITTKEAYVETYRYTDLCPSQEQSLIYAYRVTSAKSNEVLGVLCLCFRLENEMEGIFQDLISKDDWAVGLLLDSQHQVVASSNEHQIPIGAELEVAQENQDWILTPSRLKQLVIRVIWAQDG
jgi:hypothetical protein